MQQIVYVLFWSMLAVNFLSPAVVFLWVNRRTESLWSAIRASVLTATAGAFVVSGIVGCLLFVPGWLIGGDPPSWVVFVETGFFGLVAAELGLLCIFLCATARLIYRLAVTADAPSKATDDRESQCNP
jgi:hypothetical protein